MESRWRYNVAETGWSDGPYRLIARKLGAPLVFWIAAHVASDGMYTILQDSLFLGFPQPFAVLPIPTTNPHFPYGWDVVAD